MKTTKTFYRLVTPGTFADRNCKTIKDAEEAKVEFGKTSEGSAYYDYWQEQKAKCKIVKVTEITEEIN